MIHNVNPPTREKLRCELCFFFQSGAASYGKCIARAPKVIIISDQPATVFPVVWPDERCGEYSYDKAKDPDHKKGDNR